MSTLAGTAGAAIAEPVLSAGVFRTPVTTRGGIGIVGVLMVCVGWMLRRRRSTLPNYVVLASTARDLLVFTTGRKIDEVGRLLRREPLHKVRAHPDRWERSHFKLVVDGATWGWLTAVTVDVSTQSLVDHLSLAPESRPRAE